MIDVEQEVAVRLLNITYRGRSGDALGVTIVDEMSDEDIRRTALEAIRAGDVPDIGRMPLDASALDDFVVDRIEDADGQARAYVRPKVPFASEYRRLDNVFASEYRLESVYMPTRFTFHSID